MKATKTKNAASEFTGGNGERPRANPIAPKLTKNSGMARSMKTQPLAERSCRVAPRTISAPQPRQTLAVSGTGVLQCGHTKVFTATILRRRLRVRGKFLRGYFFDFDARDHAILSCGELLVSLRDCSQPLHGEILKCEKQRTKIATGDFYVVR